LSAAYHMRSHSVTSYPTEVNAPRLIPARQAGVLDLPTLKGWKAELTLVVGCIPSLVQATEHRQMSRV